MNELDKKLNNIEQQLQAISSHQSPALGNPISSRSDEIDLRELFTILWRGKWWVITITFLFAIAGVVYALSLPNMYKSTGIYAPVQKQAGGLRGKLGGLASLTGVDLGGSDSGDVEQAIALVTSWPFLERVVNEHNLKPLLMGVKGWSHNSGDLDWNKDIYDSLEKKWMRDPLDKRQLEPGSFETYKTFSELLEVKYDTKTGMITVAVSHFSPEIARQWVEIIVEELNKHFQLRDMVRAQKAIGYLHHKINETSIAEMQAIFYGMIETQTKTLMLAEAGSDYLLQEVVPPKNSEQRSEPARAIICAAFLIGGFIISVFGVLIGSVVVARKHI